jgi:hypothetical protein
MQTEDAAGILADYWTEAECAAELGISVLTLRRWNLQKKGPPRTYIGRTIFYRKASVRDWLAAQERPIERHSSNRKSAIA